MLQVSNRGHPASDADAVAQAFQMEDAMKVGILGSDEVGKALAMGFLKHGYPVMLATRAPGRLADWSKDLPELQLGTYAETAGFAELAVLAVKGSAASEALREADAVRTLAGKPLIDATNPIADVAPENGVLKFFTSLDESLMERLQTEFPQVHFVKAFNSVGEACMVDPQFIGGKPTMFICGNDAAAKQTVQAVLERFGWDAADMGMVESARAIEPLRMLWGIPGYLRNDWNHALKLLG
jgi:8-hydroxy-5-deazaflavin:NADPH oxidoreductase